MKYYHIDHVHGSYLVQHKRNGRWVYYGGKDHILFNSHDAAYQWVVEKKLNGNQARAQLAII